MGKEVTMNRIRDAAYSAACATKKVGLKAAKTLAGHRFDDETDAYVKLCPETVNPIEADFFPSKSKRRTP